MSVSLRNGIGALERSGAPSSPVSGMRLLYPKADGWYGLDSTGAEVKLGQMSGTSVSALAAAASLADTDVLLGVNGGASKKFDLSTLTAYFESRGRQHNAAVATQTTGAVDVYITNSDVPIPANRLQAKSKYRLDLSLTKAGAGTGTPTFNVRVGTAGALADASRVLFTWPAANTAVADEMKVEILCTFRSVGSGTAAVIEGQLVGQHELTTTGFGGTGLGSTIILNTTGGGFDSTVASLRIGCSVNPGTAGAWSIRQAQAVLENLA